MQPHCDIETGKIYGCKEGSWYYEHEKGHLEFNSNPATSKLIMIQQFIFLFWMLCITARNYWLGWLTFAGYCGIYVYEEWWANRYAFNKLKLENKEQKLRELEEEIRKLQTKSL